MQRRVAEGKAKGEVGAGCKELRHSHTDGHQPRAFATRMAGTDPMHAENILVTSVTERANTFSRVSSAATKANYHTSDHKKFHEGVARVPHNAATAAQYRDRVLDPKNRTDARAAQRAL